MSAGGSSEPNLTPFIDLFSVLTCFLLMTAAWIQLESMSVQIDKPPPQATSANDLTPPPPEDKKVHLSVILSGEKVVLKEDDKEMAIPSPPGGFDKPRLLAALAKWRDKYPGRHDLVLNTDASATYGGMIHLYDLLISADWSEVGINPN
jgi:biopolymer transport protein ExbD